MSLRAFSRVLGGVAASVVLLAGTVGNALAATTSTTSGNGLKVSPVTSNISIQPGETQTVQITVQNVTQGTVTLQVLVNDFTATNDESGTPALLLNPNQYAPSHSLKRYVAPISDFTLGPGDQKVVTVSISIPKNAPGGGYYGAVRFAPSGTSTKSNVTLSASVGSLILVRVPGDVKEQLKLLSFDVRGGDAKSPSVIFTTGTGLVAVARFENDGDVQEQPFGKVVLKQGNAQITSYEINSSTPRGNVLPVSVRKFTVSLDKVGSFGKYTVVGNFGFGSNGQLLTGETTFYVIPMALLLVLGGVVIVLLFAIFGLPRLIRSYNRSVLARAGRR